MNTKWINKQVYDAAMKEYIETDKGLKYIAVKHHIYYTRFSKYLKENGINVKSKYHIKNVNTLPFIEKEEDAYWFGFLLADGSVNSERYSLEVALKEGDLDHLEKLKHYFNSDRSIKYREKTKSYRIIIYSKELIKNLISLGCVQNKTYLLNMSKCFENVPKHLINHFIRGYFDGDGSILRTKKTSMCAHKKEVLEIILYNLPDEIKKRTIYEERSLYSFQYGVKKSKLFLNYLYDNANVYLNRKYLLYLKFCRS